MNKNNVTFQELKNLDINNLTPSECCEACIMISYALWHQTLKLSFEQTKEFDHIWFQLSAKADQLVPDDD